MASSTADDSAISSADENMDPAATESKEKKRKFQPMKAIRNFFKGRKKAKKDEGISIVSVKSKSTGELAHAQDSDNEASSGQLGGHLSMSADSVFQADQRSSKISQLKDTAVSMESLPIKSFNSKSGKSRSDGSLLSMGSSDNDDEDPVWPYDKVGDFFNSTWQSSVSVSPRKHGSPAPKSDMDFDALKRSDSLSNAAARHKISVKPRKHRSSSKLRKSHTNLPSIEDVRPLSEIKEVAPPAEEKPMSAPKEAEMETATAAAARQTVVIELGKDEKVEVQLRNKGESALKRESPDKKRHTVSFNTGNIQEQDKEKRNSDSSSSSSKPALKPPSPNQTRKSWHGAPQKVDWDNFDKSIETSKADQDGEKTEFAAAFMKLRRRASSKNGAEKSDVQVQQAETEKRSSEIKTVSQESQKKSPPTSFKRFEGVKPEKPEKPKKVEFKAVQKAEVVEAKKEEPKAVEIKDIVKAPEVVKIIEIEKPKPVESPEKTKASPTPTPASPPKTMEIVIEDTPKKEQVKKPVVFELKKTEIKVASNSSENKENVQEPSMTETNAFKKAEAKDSRERRNNPRSKTLPGGNEEGVESPKESPRGIGYSKSFQIRSADQKPQIKRGSLHFRSRTNPEETESKDPLIKPVTPRNPPKKLVIKEEDSNGKLPPWVALARKRQTEESKEEKDAANKKEEEEETPAQSEQRMELENLRNKLSRGRNSVANIKDDFIKSPTSSTVTSPTKETAPPISCADASSSAAGKNSKVLDMVKNFQKLQVN